MSLLAFAKTFNLLSNDVAALKPSKQKIILKLVENNLQEEKDFEVESPELVEERACILSCDMGIDFEWAIIVSQIRNMRRPNNINLERWREAISACHALYKNEFDYLKKIILCGWSPYDIFGCNIKSPTMNFDVMGLVLILRKGDHIIDISDDNIKLKKPSGSVLLFRKRICESPNGSLISEL